MARYFRLPFADSGDKDPLPDETANSLVSYATGYSQDYQRNPSSDPLARRMERNFFNQLLFDVTDTLKNLYETGTVPFITSAMNNGSPFSYPLGARVILSNRIYENTTANNTTTPPAAGWVLVDVVGMDARYLLESNNLSDLTNDDTARNNLSVYSRAETFTRTEQDARYLLEANNLSDLTNTITAQSNLGLGTAARLNTGTGSNNIPTTGQADARFLNEASNLADLPSATTARTNLGLGTAATVNTGTASTSVPTTGQADARYLNDDRFRWASQISFNSGIAVPTSAVGVYFWFNSIEDRTGIINQVVSGSTIEIFRYRTGSGGDIVSSFSLLAAGSSTLTRSNTGSAFLRWIYRS